MGWERVGGGEVCKSVHPCHRRSSFSLLCPSHRPLLFHQALHARTLAHTKRALMNIGVKMETGDAEGDGGSSSTGTMRSFDDVPCGSDADDKMEVVRCVDGVEEHMIDLVYKRADCQRASRESRGGDLPYELIKQLCAKINGRYNQLTGSVADDDGVYGSAFKEINVDDVPRMRANSGLGNKSSYVTSYGAPPEDRAEFIHMVQLWGKTVQNADNPEPTWLYAGCAPSRAHHDRLLEAAFRASARNNSTTQRAETQGAGYQTTRIQYVRWVGAAASVQCVHVSVAKALALATMARCAEIEGTPVVVADSRDPLAIDPGTLHYASERPGQTLVISTNGMTFNSNTVLLGKTGILKAAALLAQQELDEGKISTLVGQHPWMLHELCKAACRNGNPSDGVCDVWASIVLLHYVGSHPRSRQLLDGVGLTDVDVLTVATLEQYGRAQIHKRSKQQQQAARDAPASDAKGAQESTASPSTDAKDSMLGSATILPSAQYGIVAGMLHQSAVGTTNSEWDLNDYIKDAALTVQEQGHPRGFAGKRPFMEGAADYASDIDTSNLHTPAHASDDEEERRVVTKKRILPGSGLHPGTANATCADGTLRWWTCALRSEHKDMLTTLVTGSKDTARNAAVTTLRAQTTREPSEVQKNQAVDTVFESSKNMRRAVTAFDDQLCPPRAIAWRFRNDSSFPSHELSMFCSKTMVGMHAIGDDSAVLHTCAASNAPCEIGIVTLWSTGSWELHHNVGRNPDEEAETVARGLGANVAQLSKLEGLGGGMSTHTRAKEALRRKINAMGLAMWSSVDSLVTRSFVSLCMTDLKAESTVVEALCKDLQTVRAALASDSGAHFKMGSVYNGTEPHCGRDSPRLAIGLRINELLRRVRNGKNRKHKPANMLLSFASERELSMETADVPSSEPWPLATICNFTTHAHVRKDARTRDAVLADLRSHDLKTSATLHICLERAVRVPAALQQINDVMKRRALLYVAASQASLIGDLAMSMSAVSANTSIANAQRIQCADLTTLPLLTPFDAYVGGLTNLERSFAGTAYSGAYGPRVDTGITPPGIAGRNAIADRRAHGAFTLSENTKELMAQKFAEAHYASDLWSRTFAPRPIETRGIPWGYVPGVHKCMSAYHEVCQEVAGKTFGDSKLKTSKDMSKYVWGVFVLPFSADTQVLRPDVNDDQQTSRFCFRRSDESPAATGRSYLSDATNEDEAKVREPLFRRPAQVGIGDNAFATSYEYADSLNNALHTLALIAIEVCRDKEGVRVPGRSKAPEDTVATLKAHLDAFHDAEAPEIVHAKASGANEKDVPSYLWAIDACVLLCGAVYPATHNVGEPVVPDVYAKLAPILARRVDAARVSDEKCDRLDALQLLKYNDDMYNIGARPWCNDVVADLSPWCDMDGCDCRAYTAADAAGKAKIKAKAEESSKAANGAFNDAKQRICAWWRAHFRRTDARKCPWQTAIAPNLVRILTTMGRHDLSRDDRKAARKAFNHIVTDACTDESDDHVVPGEKWGGARAFYSDDGTQAPAHPNPLCDTASSKDVRRWHVDPVFFLQGDSMQIEPRGCLVGLKPFQLRQLLSLMVGAHVAGVREVQVVRNEGNLLLRESAHPLVLKSDGSKRSKKAISAVQTEADGPAFGRRFPKEYGAGLQQRAWDANAAYMLPLCLELEMPKFYPNGESRQTPSTVEERMRPKASPSGSVRENFVRAANESARWLGVIKEAE